MKEQIEGLEKKKLARPMNTIFEIWEKILNEVVQSCFDHLKQYLPRVIEVDGALP